MPQGSVLRPLLFYIVMATFPKALPFNEIPFVRIAIHADVIVLLCVGHSWQTRIVKARLKDVLSNTYHQLEVLALSVSHIKRELWYTGPEDIFRLRKSLFT